MVFEFRGHDGTDNCLDTYHNNHDCDELSTPKMVALCLMVESGVSVEFVFALWILEGLVMPLVVALLGGMMIAFEIEFAWSAHVQD